MAFNFLEMAKSSISKSTIEQMAIALDLDEESMGAAINIVIPTLVGGMINKAQSPAGANELFEMLEQHDGSLLGNIGDLVTGGRHAMLVETGQKMLPSLFGDKLTSIIGTTGKRVGFDSTSTSSLLGMLVPILMSVLGKQKKAAGWDVDKFSSALMRQKELMPNLDPGLMKAPKTGNLPGSRRESKALPDRVVATGSDRAKATSGHAAPVGGSFLKVVVPLLVVIALSVLAWNFLLAPPAPQPNPVLPNTDQASDDGSGSGLASDLDVGGSLAQVKDMFRNIMTIIESVKDEATAKSAATRLDELAARVDGLGLGKLDGMARTGFQIAAKAFRSSVNEILEKVYKSPGVEPILKPAVEALLNKFGGA